MIDNVCDNVRCRVFTLCKTENLRSCHAAGGAVLHEVKTLQQVVAHAAGGAVLHKVKTLRQVGRRID